MTKSEKDLLQSKTFWGLFVAGVAALLAHFGVTVDQTALVNECVTGVGLAFAVYGRMVANVPVTSIFGLVTKASAKKSAAKGDTNA